MNLEDVKALIEELEMLVLKQVLEMDRSKTV
jgi:hypothetical protein